MMDIDFITTTRKHEDASEVLSSNKDFIDQLDNIINNHLTEI